MAQDYPKSAYRAFFWLFLLQLLCSPPIRSQHQPPVDYTLRDPLHAIAPDNFLCPDTTFNSQRFWLTTGTGLTVYTVSSIGLYHIWYKGYDRTSFHTFDDWPEWHQMDKAGHFFAAYMINRYSHAGFMWTGLDRSTSRWAALGVANLLQGTIEVFDGTSAKWGFSWSDIGANLAGSLFFTVQDAVWHEQRILIKCSNDFRAHPDIPVYGSNGSVSNLSYVSRLRFGDYPFERYLKDYNTMTIWMSANPASFLPELKIPPWINIAVGMSAENVYGAYGNVWRQNGNSFRYPEERYRQWFLSPDIYFSRIPTRKRWVRFTLGILDIIKFPAPAIEFSQGKFKFHALKL